MDWAASDTRETGFANVTAWRLSNRKNTGRNISILRSRQGFHLRQATFIRKEDSILTAIGQHRLGGEPRICGDMALRLLPKHYLTALSPLERDANTRGFLSIAEIFEVWSSRVKLHKITLDRLNDIT